MAKGNKRCSWVKNGIKDARRAYKKRWNRKLRRTGKTFQRCGYKKIAGIGMYDRVV